MEEDDLAILSGEMGDDDLPILSGEELRQLAKLIYMQEEEAILSRPFESSLERDQYLEECGSAYDSVLAILKAAEESKDKYQNDDAKASIAHETFEYVEKAINTALQNVVNYSIRVSYLKKLRDHTDTLLAALEQLDSKNVAEVARIAEDTIKYRDAMVKCLKNYKSDVSRSFSKSIKTAGMTFNQLVKKYQVKIGYEGAFADLEDTQKLKVYDEIIKESGRGNIFKMEVKEAAAAAVLLLAAGIMVWDIFSSGHEIETAARDAAEIVASVAGTMLGDVVQGVVATLLADTVEASAIFALGVGLLTGFVGTFIIGAFAGAILDAIFGSGGSAPLSTDGIQCQVAPLPDGAVLARQIWHQDHVQAPSDA